ncbi:MAG: thioredoxin family protein, partial [Chloroflexi bacterium]|nr:thioredoxin family protein [Chloroflexota bacterium]
MAQKVSVVTPARFASGFTYPDYIAQIKVNKELFQRYYESAHLSTEDAAFFLKAVKSPSGPAKVLVLGEDWCPDVYRGMPVMARIAEASGMEMRVFPRDQHLDIMNEFLKEGKYQSIPTAVFYTRDHKYICHWIERPAVANQEQAEIEKAIRAENPNITDQEFAAQRRARSGARAADWQQATVAEIVDSLAKNSS